MDDILTQAINLLKNQQCDEVIKILSSCTGPSIAWVRGLAYKQIGFRTESHQDAIHAYQEAIRAFRTEAETNPETFFKLARSRVSRTWALPAYIAALHGIHDKKEYGFSSQLPYPSLYKILDTLVDIGPSAASATLHLLESMELDLNINDPLTRSQGLKVRSVIQRMRNPTECEVAVNPAFERLTESLASHNTKQEDYTDGFSSEIFDFPMSEHIKRLESKDCIVRTQAIGVIGARQPCSEKSMGLLRAALNSGRASIRCLALFGMCERIRQGYASADYCNETLLSIEAIALHDRSYLARKLAVKELEVTVLKAPEKLNSTRVVEILTTCLSDNDQRVRLAAVITLGKIGKPAEGCYQRIEEMQKFTYRPHLDLDPELETMLTLIRITNRRESASSTYLKLMDIVRYRKFFDVTGLFEFVDQRHDKVAKALIDSDVEQEKRERLLIEMIFLEHSATLANYAKQKALSVFPHEQFVRLGLDSVPI